MDRSSILLACVVSALSLPLVACDSTGPGPEAVDAVATSQRLQSLTDSILTQNEGMQSFVVLEPLMLDALGAPFIFTAFEGAFALGTGRPLSDWIDEVRASPRTDAALLAIPSELLGKTLVYNPETGLYEVNEMLAGAPPNGVRLILYEVPLPTSPLDPLVAIGHVDIEAAESASAVTVSVTVVARDETILDYTVSRTVGTTPGTITVAGFIANGTDRLDFNGSITGTETSPVLDFDLRSGDLRVHIRVEVDVQAVSLRVEIRDGSNVIVLQFDVGEAFAIDGSVAFNGTPVALISGTEANPVITNASGGDLSEEELEAVRQIFFGGAVALGVTLDLLFFGLLLLPLGMA